MLKNRFNSIILLFLFSFNICFQLNFNIIYRTCLTGKRGVRLLCKELKRKASHLLDKKVENTAQSQTSDFPLSLKNTKVCQTKEFNKFILYIKLILYLFYKLCKISLSKR